ncbi:YesK family protein [Priestia megaterium]|uniref:YesK family protein n=1 Tax=Priestia TaxID=2800373 RepID=UPI0035DA060C
MEFFIEIGLTIFVLEMLISYFIKKQFPTKPYNLIVNLLFSALSLLAVMFCLLFVRGFAILTSIAWISTFFLATIFTLILSIIIEMLSKKENV